MQVDHKGLAVEVVCIASWNADLVSRVPQPLARGETMMASAFRFWASRGRLAGLVHCTENGCWSGKPDRS